MLKPVQEKAPILRNGLLQGDYFQVDLQCDRIAPAVAPGQFVHVRFPVLEHRLLRRPFSVYDVEPETGVLSIVYKVVGEGTRHLSTLAPPGVVDVMGPLGRGFRPPPPDAQPVVVAGGYGCAATYIFVRRCPQSCLVLIGGRSAEDLLLTDEFARLGAEVRVTTEDGTRGQRGRVTELLPEALEAVPHPHVIACGPNPMLRAVGKLVSERGLDAELSLDHAMCCGVGACFACVVKMKADNEQGWEYVRTCREGPVFPASRVYWDDTEDVAFP